MKAPKKAKYPSLHIVERAREGTKVKQHAVAHLALLYAIIKLQKKLKGARAAVERNCQTLLTIDKSLKFDEEIVLKAWQQRTQTNELDTSIRQTLGFLAFVLL